MRLIEKLEPSRHVQGRFLVWLEGEREPLRVTENEVASFALYSGRTLEEEELAELRQAGGLSSAKARGARMLGERPLSKRELIRRLEQKGDAPEHAQAAADWLEEIGALNELDYARSVVRHYTARGYGGQKLRHQQSAARSTSQGVVRKAYKLIVVLGVWTQAADGNSHAAFQIPVQFRLRPVILSEIVQKLLGGAGKLQLLGSALEIGPV